VGLGRDRDLDELARVELLGAGLVSECERHVPIVVPGGRGVLGCSSPSESLFDEFSTDCLVL
jgi:hypothetical protein